MVRNRATVTTLAAPRVVAHPTTTVVPVAKPRPAPVPPPPAAPAPAPGSGGLAAVWACIRQHESGGNYAENTGNGYYGAYQFSERTWLAIGGTGYPNQAPPAVQDAMAQKLQAMAGWGQWPVTSRLCGV